MRISVVGDSHVRGYRDRANLLPLFVGPGKEFNLFRLNHNDVFSKIVMAQTKFPCEKIYLSMGEPNCRYQLGFGWHPQDEDNDTVKPIVDESVIDECVEVYIQLLTSLKIALPCEIYVLTASTCYEPTLPSIEYFNKVLLGYLGDRCVDLTEALSNIEYYKKDIIHFNENISDLFLSKILEMGHIDDIAYFKREVHIDAPFGCVRLW